VPDGRAAAPIVLIASAAADAAPLARSLRGDAGEDSTVLAVTVADDGSVPAALLDSGIEGARFVFLARDERDPTPPDVAAIDPARWHRVERARLLADPRGELMRVCEFTGIAYDQARLTPIEVASRAAQTGEDSGRPSPFASSSTSTFGEAVRMTGGSLLISTYQTHRLVCVRARDGELNTHFREYDKPMGLAVAPGRIAIGTRTEVFDLRDMPEAARSVEPGGAHDACYLPRNRHVTGDIAIHELAYAGNELWLIATAFSCLATLDADHSFVPRWAPPFITKLAPEDRCHLNGMAIVDGRVAYVTALGATDEAGGWRAGKVTGGILMHVPSSEVAIAGLSMPHSPRWHQGRLWLLESGRGTLCAADPAAGTVEVVAELPGFTRGLAFAGETAFVGLSQIRESSTFGDLPVTHRLKERQSGVWTVDLRSGAVTGFLRFDDLVQEIFDVALLPGARHPEIAEPSGTTTARSYALP
jgi:uncharacterized protein (TIGR03032 family)